MGELEVRRNGERWEVETRVIYDHFGGDDGRGGYTGLAQFLVSLE